MTENKRFTLEETDWSYRIRDNGAIMKIPKIVDLLNDLNEEKEWLEINNKDLVSFIKSKGYTLKDFLKYIGRFRSVGVNKEDWND